MVGNCLEAELLLCCARISSNSDRAEQLRALLRKDPDWALVLRIAHRHWLAPLVFWRLSQTCPEAVPTDVLDRLRDDFRANSLRNLYWTGELLELLGTFEKQGIPTISFKGPTLAALAYDNVALRQFGDLDILVRKRDVPKAKKLLVSAGYRPAYRLNDKQEAALLQHHSEHPFTREDDGSIVDLHWEIVERRYSFALDTERLWERLERVHVGGEVIPTLSTEELLLIVCQHGSKHLWEGLGWICDVAGLLHARRDINWGQLMEEAARLGSERMLFLGLFLASDLLGAPLPNDVLYRAETDPKVRALAGEVHEGLSRVTNGLSPRFVEESPFYLFHLKMRERLRDKVRYCVRAATTTTVGDWASLPLPRYLFPAYYVVRPIRLVGKYGRRLLERFV